jgi:GNAT superfamily N-acetyltransferase
LAPFTLRRAEWTDVQTLVELRIAYLKEVERLADEIITPALIEQTRRYFSRKMPSNEYSGWVAVARPTASADRRGKLSPNIIGTAGIFSYDRPPIVPGEGREARLTNVFVVDSWRGRGVANALIDACVETARRAGVHRILVDDSPAGRSLYERAGFTMNNTIMELVW